MKIIIICLLAFILSPVNAQFRLFGDVLKNDTIFTADITGTDTLVARKLRAPDGALIWYEFPSFATTSTAQVLAGYSTDGEHFQPITMGSTSTIFTLDATAIMYDAVGDTVMGQQILGTNFVGQYWVTLLRKGNSTADTLIIHYSK